MQMKSLNHPFKNQNILVLGSGPIIIGQACEFDYSGVQACKALKEEGCRVIVINSNPATIMTDPDYADATYIELLQWEWIEKVIQKERPNALLPTVGGQTALNCVMDLVHHRIIEKYDIKIIGVSPDTIEKAENRHLFKNILDRLGLDTPFSMAAFNYDDALKKIKNFNFPVIIRSSFTLGGEGSGIASNISEFKELVANSLSKSSTSILIEESVIGWKEYELEVMRDRLGNCIVVCSVENLDPMGVHTGDSITVAPAQTLTDKEYQRMRIASFDILQAIGMTSGGCNVQFAVNPYNGRLLVIEVNPRVSRSSALASKATGFPIAKIATKLALGYTLNELYTGNKSSIHASFEPTLDYVVTKIPRFNFDKFIHSTDFLTTQMKSVGEVMAIGRTFQESLQKAIQSLEIRVQGLNSKFTNNTPDTEILKRKLERPNSERLWYIADAFRFGWSVEAVFELTKIDPWFLYQIYNLVCTEKTINKKNIKQKNNIFKLKKKGFSDSFIGKILGLSEYEAYQFRKKVGVKPIYKRVDSCGAEIPTETAYMYSTYETDGECESFPTNHKKIIVIGSGPNRIGQGIEFDYCCVHASLAIRENKYEAIMINCNPETTSTDCDVSDRLYFEPLTLEKILSIIELENPQGVIVQFGGQTSLQLTNDLKLAKVPILGTSPETIDICEDRERFRLLLKELNLNQPLNTTFTTIKEAFLKVKSIGFPCILRPSYAIGGRGMVLIENQLDLETYFEKNFIENGSVLMERYLANAIEVDVDAVCDGTNVLIAGIMEHIEPAGVHSGDSSCVFPPHTLVNETQKILKEQTRILALRLNVIGLINVQFAVKSGIIYVLEVNPRASRTIPFISKSTGVPLAKVATHCILGKSLKEQGFHNNLIPYFFSIKSPVFSHNKLGEIPIVLGPEMKSTGEMMSIGKSFAEALVKSKINSNNTSIINNPYEKNTKGEDFVYFKKEIFCLQEITNNSTFLIEAIA